MNSDKNKNGFAPPFPALTPAQRYHLEVNGYVVVKNLLTSDEVSTFYEALQKLKEEFFATDDPWNTTIRNCTIGGEVFKWAGPQVRFINYLATDPLFMDHVAHPRIMGIAQEMVGSQVRVESTPAIINSRAPDVDPVKAARLTWHRMRYGSYTENGLFHCSLVNALTNLTDLGPDDGGTVVIAGSHKITCAEEHVVEATREDPSLIHQVVAPAGSTLFFYETMLHATGEIRSDKERVVMIARYCPANYATHRVISDEETLKTVPEALRPLITGRYDPRPRRRLLGTTVGAGRIDNYSDGWSLDGQDPDKVSPTTTTRASASVR